MSSVTEEKNRIQTTQKARASKARRKHKTRWRSEGRQKRQDTRWWEEL